MLTWRPPAYNNDRRLAFCGEVEVGAVFPPIGGKYWRWRFWLNGLHTASDGSEKTEELAKYAVAARFVAFLRKAALQPIPEPPQ
jgi:hypothetical protein